MKMKDKLTAEYEGVEHIMLKKISKIHNEAMLLVDKADLAKLKNENHLEFLREAYRKEKQAAYMLKDSEMEPSRSILLRSAASLGYEIGEYNESEKLVCLALSGNPPKNIAEELKNLYEDIYLRRERWI